MDITVFENADIAQPFTLKYDHDWIETAKQGQSIAQADVTRVYFYANTTDSSTSPWLTLTDASSSQIEWVSTGNIRVKFGSNTTGRAGSGHYYELRIKFTDGAYVSMLKGRLHVKESLVDRP